MKELQTIADDIYYRGELVAKLIPCSNHSLQGDFIDEINVDEEIYREKYINLCDALPGSSTLDDVENLLKQIKRTTGNKALLDDIDSELQNLRNALDYMWSEVD